MINSKDVESIKELVIGALLQANGGDFKKYFAMKEIVQYAFDIVVGEMRDGGI